MKTNKKIKIKTKIKKFESKDKSENNSSDFVDKLWDNSWTYIKTVIDIVREPVLILDKDFCVVDANEPFYKTFQVVDKETKGHCIYELGNGQWDIPELRKLLEDILPKHTFFKGFEVTHEFPVIGRKVMILNARQIHTEKIVGSVPLSPIILLAIEDISNLLIVAQAVTDIINKKKHL